ncbi:MAG: CinA family nicotinamide mononucleotide deamidase-related protein [Candidatus Riflebacteria bacterium]|nr:CinA family nicotinamide mononucleotide deamidase-related protein [Candidatus Riflebacteria bacterium]
MSDNNRLLKRLRAEIISIGTELLLGEITDTNAPFLACELKKHGVDVFHKQTVGDNRVRLAEAFRLAATRADLIVTSGGLGPTAGDLTREAIADLVGQTPVIDQNLLAGLTDLFSAKKRKMPDINRKQAWLIPAATSLANPIGTAPGWLVSIGSTRIIALPGPPHEMQRMWLEQALPKLDLPDSAFFATILHTFGIGEGNLVERLAKWIHGANPTIATYARPHGVDIRVAASAPTKAEAETIAQPIVEDIITLVGNACYGRDEETLAGVVMKTLAASELTVAVGERFTAGRLCELFLETSVHAREFCEGVVLRPPANRAERTDWTVHEVEELRRRSGADWVICTGAGTHVENVRAAKATVHEKRGTTGSDVFDSIQIALLGPGGHFLEEYLDWPGERKYLRERAAHAALMFLLKALRNS